MMRGWLSSIGTPAQAPPSSDRREPSSRLATSGDDESGSRDPGGFSSQGMIDENSEGVSELPDTARSRRGLGSLTGVGRSDDTRRGSQMASLFYLGRSVASADAEMERRVSAAARDLGDGVQKIVLEAKKPPGTGPDAWKNKLLLLLGGSDNDVSNKRRALQASDLEKLLANSTCEKFVLRCVENELPPNLIHCLRLLRVLELQHAQSQTDESDSPLSSYAATKVSKLLCRLCKDPSVGEQLRPHLFGLLALSGASYPPCGLHVAQAASEVILAFCESCLSNSLVWFLHDRKMVVHMTDDLKELCGMTSISSTSTKCLYGKEAEKAGLWIIGLKTLISLVTHSCEYQCTELIQDYDAAGGYHVLSYAIAHSDGSRVPKLLELVTMLVYCKTEANSTGREQIEGSEKKSSSKDEKADADMMNSKLATNVNAFEIVEDLMVRSIPFLSAFIQAHEGQRPSLESQNVRELADFSVKTAHSIRLPSTSPTPPRATNEPQSSGFDLASELLVTTLQLYSDHGNNFSIVESKYNILSYYLLAFPTFSDVSIKVLILKTLEYICTALSGSSTVIPLTVASELFLSLCMSLLRTSPNVKIEESGTNDSKVSPAEKKSDDETKIFECLLLDAESLCETLEKLLQIDETVSTVMHDCGLLDEKVNQFLTLVVSATEQTESNSDQDIGSPKTPPKVTGMDGPFSAVCRILKLVACQQNFETSISSASSKPPPSHGMAGQQSGHLNLNVLLTTAVKSLGDKASKDALSVFESIMCQRHMGDLLEDDFTCLLDLLRHFADCIGKKRCSKISESQEEKDDTLDVQTILRVLQVLDMLKVVIETNELAQDFFRIKGGYETISKLLSSLEKSFPDDKFEDDNDDQTSEGKKEEEVKEKSPPVMLMIETCFDILSSSTIPKEKKTEEKDSNEAAVSSLSSLASTNLKNRQYLLRSGFYTDFSTAISNTGAIHPLRYALKVLNLSLSMLEPNIRILPPNENPTDDADTEPINFIRNPDAVRLVLGISVHLPLNRVDLAKRALDEMLRLCASGKEGSSLSQIAQSELTRSLTSSQEFGPQLENRNHPLYSRFVLLLRRIAAFYMSYMDFVSLLRFIAGPILQTGTDTQAGKIKGKGRVQLPVISSMIKTNDQQVAPKAISDSKTESRKLKETDIRSRLETIAIIAARGDRVSRCNLGGDNLNTIALYMQKVPVEERLFNLAQDGGLKFIHIKGIDSSAASKTGTTVTSGSTSSSVSNTAADKVWPPFSSCGFSYSLWLRLPVDAGESATGSLFLLDFSTPGGATFSISAISSSSSGEFLSVWYDLNHEQFCVLTSATSRHDPVRFPRAPLVGGVWHHVLLTYVPPKRPMLSRKASVSIYIDGRSLDAEVRVENVNLPPTSVVHIGAPNSILASSGTVRGSLPQWELGPTIMVSTVLSGKEATAMFSAGPDFEGLFWGDRPQRLSLTATATATFAMLAESGEKGSVAGALRRRNVPEVEAAGHVMREKGSQEDTLSSVGLLCDLNHEDIVFGFRAAARSDEISKNGTHVKRLINVARINTHENISSDGFVYGKESVITPNSFADNVQWVGGPNTLMPLVNAMQTPASMAVTLRLINESVRRHSPNLENLQGGGGYRILGLLLRQKQLMDTSVMDQCFAFAVHGFETGPEAARQGDTTDNWVLTDLDAMKYLLLNHQVWDMRRSGPELPLRLLHFLNNLVAANSAHAAFNSRRLHLLGIVRWTLHLLLEAAELYDAQYDSTTSPNNENPHSVGSINNSSPKQHNRSPSSVGKCWKTTSPSVASTAVGGDPGNPLLRGCKSLLRRVLTYMLTPDDLEAIAGIIIYTLSITASHSKPTDTSGEHAASSTSTGSSSPDDERLAPGPVARIYLLRLLEELVVDGVNEIVAANTEKKSSVDADDPADAAVLPHAGGGTSANQYYLATSMLARKKFRTQQPTNDVTQHPKHQQAQAFLSAFAGILTPVWFACVLEGSREEASASAALRLMMLMLQSSPTFSAAFEAAGGFSPLVLSIPKFSTCPAIIMAMLSQLLHAPILHLPCFATLDSAQLCEVFDLESDATILVMNDSTQGGLQNPSDPSCGIFALLAECLGRNIQLASYPNEPGRKAKHTNESVIRLLGHRHTFSSSFQEFCRTPDFLEPLAQALCLVHDEKVQRMIRNIQSTSMGRRLHSDDLFESQHGNEFHDSYGSGFGHASDGAGFMDQPNSYSNPYDSHPYQNSMDSRAPGRAKRRGSLSDVDTTETPTERFVGKNAENETSGIGMVQLLHMILSHSVLSGPTAATLLAALFRSFPIHASLEQVEAFHLVLIEHCRNVVEDALQRGEPIALANCIGLSSVLLDRLMAGFFTSEPVLETVHIVLTTLRSLTATGTYASRTLANADQTMLVADTAHFARLTCLTALHRSRPSGPYDEGDDDLKLAVLQEIAYNLRQLLLIPGGAGLQGKRQGGAPAFIPPQPGNRFYPLYQSASLSRCSPPGVTAIYPELYQIEQPDRAFVVALMSQIYNLLLDKRRDVREQAVVIVVSLLDQRKKFMKELLITEIHRGESRMETVDLMNRGGFGALMVAAEAARIDESISTVPRNISTSRQGSGNGGMSIGKLKYASFFEWLERNQPQVSAVFHGIHIQASRLLPGIGAGAATPEEAIENEQKVMLLKLTSQDSSDRTIQGGIKRAELAETLHKKTTESHTLWKRQGFDDLSSGAMLWKLLLRQLKGTHSIWEGGYGDDEETSLSSFSNKFLRVSNKTSMIQGENAISENGGKAGDNTDGSSKDKKVSMTDVQNRWKLDLTEGYERQRRRLIPNHEFQSLYNLNRTNQSAEGEVSNPSPDGQKSLRDEEKSEMKHIRSDLVRGVATAENSEEDMAALVREMQLRAGTKDVDLFDEEYDQSAEEGAEDLENNEEDADPGLDGFGDAGKLNDGAGISSSNALSRDRSQRQRDSSAAGLGMNADAEGPDRQDEDEDSANNRDNTLASSYDLITGLLEPGDWPEKSYNVERCTGLEVRKALLLWCHDAIYIVDGFEQTEGDGLEGKINRLQVSTSTFDVSLRTGEDGQPDAGNDKNSSGSAGGTQKGETQIAGNEITYQHRSQRIAFSDLYSVYRRRYQLQQIALEFYDVNRYGTLVAFSSEEEREEVLSKVLNSPLPNSIFASNSMSGTTSINYNRFMNSLRAKITNQWVNGRMTNFEFIMHLNSFAGRTYNDLTQYPVFPWVLRDYQSEEIDFDDPKIYRDLSKPMGAQSESRAQQYQERFEVLEDSHKSFENEPPPFHYGTHYSCAAYVLYYLMRLEPFSRMALSFQGGKFDLAERLFQDVGASWKSASEENLQDVRELIPEFFYLPEFLVNTNMFDLGTTQGGMVVNDVALPLWAKGDPKRFIRINRQALESDYVSKNLHNWVDIIFGYKQRGREAVKALNTFVHLTYEGQVDLNAIQDPMQREATIAQIHNFGQTPSRLERKPFPQRNVYAVAKEKSIDFSALFFLAANTPPFCIVGAPHRVQVRVSSMDTCRVGMAGQTDSSVGDMCLVKGQLLGVGRTCALILPSKKYYRFGGANNGVSVHVAIASARHREIDKVISIHDGMHRAPISIAKPSLNGEWLVTGCTDSTVRVWKFNGKNMTLKASLCGHEGGKVTCIDVSTVFGTIVTGGADGNVLVWDLRRVSFLRQLKHKQEENWGQYDGRMSSGFKDCPVLSVSINHKNGHILTLVGSVLSLFDINGNLLATQAPDSFKNHNRPSCAIATNCPEWMENGIVAVSGHTNGDVRLWSLNYETEELVMRHLVSDKVHSCSITALRVSGDMQDTLLVGDKSGQMSICKAVRLDDLNQQELNVILKEIQTGMSFGDVVYTDKSKLSSDENDRGRTGE